MRLIELVRDVVMVPFAFARTRLRVSWSAGEPAHLRIGCHRGRVPCESANSVCPRPISTSTARRAPEATVVAVDDSGLERHDLPVLRLVRHRAGFRDVDRVSAHREPCRDDVSELDHLRDRSVQRDAIHAVVMSVRDEESAAERFERVLHAGRHGEGTVGGGLLQANVPMSATSVELEGPSMR